MIFSRVEVAATAPDGTGRNFWFVFASEHADLAALHDELKAGSAFGWRLDTERTEGGPARRRESKRYPIVLGTHGLISIQPLHETLEAVEGIVGS